MHLTKLELQGFKTFAKKTELSFLPPSSQRCPITAVVGPNGSGKSNLADAIRWVLGEQSLKLLRGKESQDVIFSGSEGKGRAGFAQVSLSLNNEDGSMPIDYTHVTITRRLYRDGTSEYLLNESPVRLADIQLLLAQANVGQRSYSVVGQGMIDHILVSTPEERKSFFDDA
ncbi:MAG: Chromosome partition protein Smc, partial [Candidatus Uhrbacteria bacterium GW2011_GWA2_52_8d]